ncbi:NAD(P)H-dependent oxidoreductase [Parahaliea mediterranea]|uniref:NAD(P)H-dependent oxidoreductase n=1 Tax=Parahaliea mediterranea TaxID=651086 RepID=A0A939IPH9_9GAMM|nr:NAD(P)H-dependent oxidoreductase [Parahaliea mediterranea]MBN7799188.1 NAD(P)H-dependent oxidoreductase [Parahaliea mediterranea]
MTKVVIVLAHPNLAESKINKPLIDCAVDMPGVAVHDLYDKYSDFKINVEKEQEFITEFDTIVIQHPLYWYSCPALLKEWLDKVFVRNFAYGKHGRALEGKNLVSVVSAGGPEETYTTEGSNEQPVRDFLKTFEVTAKFCSMLYPKPLILHNAYRVTEDEIARHIQAYSKLLSSYAGM